MKRGLILALIFLLIPIVAAERENVAGTTGFRTPECFDTGAMRVRKATIIDKTVTAEAPDGSTFNVQGEWKNNYFDAEELQFTESGTYYITVDGQSRVFDCPGLAFSCQLLSFELKDCVRSRGKLQASLEAEGTMAEDLEYEFIKGTGRKKLWTKMGFPEELTSLKFDETEEGIIKLEMDDIDDVASLKISHPRCLGADFMFTEIDCEEIAVPEMSCGRSLGVKQRAKCKLGLAKEQRAANYHPEDCAEDDTDCLDRYGLVKGCWDFPTGTSRMACVKRQMNLGEIALEKRDCNALDVGNRENCNSVLKENVYSLIKFRLHNLEKNAEKYLDLGMITEEEAASFIADIEGFKVEFDSTATKEGKKAVILKARQRWLELVRGLEK
ncbi:MAG: hypothetical protein KJ709_05705 [Nanoarchaeota archaeon]|nr:hypothetical protein [Nanoarchaeota archaeon]